LAPPLIRDCHRVDRRDEQPDLPAIGNEQAAGEHDAGHHEKYFGQPSGGAVQVCFRRARRSAVLDPRHSFQIEFCVP
jgi:hypothetical protein